MSYESPKPETPTRRRTIIIPSPTRELGVKMPGRNDRQSGSLTIGTDSLRMKVGKKLVGELPTHWKPAEEELPSPYLRKYALP